MGLWQMMALNLQNCPIFLLTQPLAQMPDGKPANKFGWDGVTQSRDYALSVIRETHHFYVNLKSGLRPNIEQLSML